MALEPRILVGAREPGARKINTASPMDLVRQRKAGVGILPSHLQPKRAKKDEAEVILQSSATGYVAQLTAPAMTEFDPRTGVRRNTKPLALNFNPLGGWVKLDLRKEADSRRYRLVVGHDAWVEKMKELGLPTEVHAEDPEYADPHPRFGVGLSMWDVKDASAKVKADKRRAILSALAADPELFEAMQEMKPEELAKELDQRRAKTARKVVVAKSKKLNLHEVDDDEDEDEDEDDQPDLVETDDDGIDEEDEAEEKPKPKPKLKKVVKKTR